MTPLNFKVHYKRRIHAL